MKFDKEEVEALEQLLVEHRKMKELLDRTYDELTRFHPSSDRSTLINDIIDALSK